MRLSVRSSLSALILAAAPIAAAFAQDRDLRVAETRYSSEELDNLLAPIALYPDPILAQALVAATFPDQLQAAADFVRAHGTRDIDEQEWDVSVKAIAHYPPVLNMMVEREDWTTALGQAYAGQSSDVMDAVQRLRELARAQGNLQSTREQNVVVNAGQVSIVPTQPTVIYVPTYDPTVVYYRPIRYYDPYATYWSFGVGFPIGVWLNYDCDWYGRRIYYDGWHGGGWRVAARPFIHISSYYVHPRFSLINININIFRRPINYVRLGRYNTIHRGVTFVRHDRGWNGGGRDDRNGRDTRFDDRRGNPGGNDRNDRPEWNRDRNSNNSNNRTDPNNRNGRNDGNDRNGRGGGRGSDRPIGPIPGAPGSIRPERPAVVRPERPVIVRPERRAETRPERPVIIMPPRRPENDRVERRVETPSRAGVIRPERQAPVERRPEVRVERGRPNNGNGGNNGARPAPPRDNRGNGAGGGGRPAGNSRGRGRG